MKHKRQLSSSRPRKSRLAISKEQLAWAKKALCDFLDSHRVMLTRSSCLNLLHHACDCSLVADEEFLRQLIEHSNDIPSLSISPQKVPLVGSSEIIRLATFRTIGECNRLYTSTPGNVVELENKKYLVGWPLIDPIRNLIESTALASRDRLRYKMNKSLQKPWESTPKVWTSSRNAGPFDSTQTSQKVLYGTLAIKLLSEEGVENISYKPCRHVVMPSMSGLRISDAPSDAYDVLRYEQAGDKHVGIFCGVGRVGQDDIRFAIERFLAKGSRKSPTVVDVFCLKQSIKSESLPDWFEVGSSFVSPIDDLYCL